MNEENEIIYELANFYKDKNVSVHITLKSGQWLNGIILSVNKDFKDRLILQEKKYGEMLVLFERIIPDGISPEKEERR